MSEADQEQAGTRASRLLVRALVIAGAVAGLSAAWTSGNEARADPGEERSIVADDAPAGLLLRDLDPSALLVPTRSAMEPLVQPVIGVVRHAGTILEPVEQAGERTLAETDEGHQVRGEADIESPSWTQEPTGPEIAPTFAEITPHAQAPVTTVPQRIEPTNRAPNTEHNPDPPVEHRPAEQPQPPVPTAPAGICGTDGAQGQAPGFGICWQDNSARPGIPPSSVLHLFEAHPLTGRADPQPGVTPD